ncbi:hypothetical protein MA16_Dca027776 [Dendrobium catenatum]|uniref:Uncharacterized protein n=1 Tax=Dendrobium catenatum TaxID=906689 RepID=A0A2I0VDK1_9ASPA|nr:hypothetical protein MA16_Dca027776 [Dendrobium catenatum]
MGNIVWTNVKIFSLFVDCLRYFEERESWREKERERKGLVSEAAERFSSVDAVGRIVCLEVRNPNHISDFEDFVFWYFSAQFCVSVTEKRAYLCINETFTA